MKTAAPPSSGGTQTAYCSSRQSPSPSTSSTKSNAKSAITSPNIAASDLVSSRDLERDGSFVSEAEQGGPPTSSARAPYGPLQRAMFVAIALAVIALASVAMLGLSLIHI